MSVIFSVPVRIMFCSVVIRAGAAGAHGMTSASLWHIHASSIDRYIYRGFTVGDVTSVTTDPANWRPGTWFTLGRSVVLAVLLCVTDQYVYDTAAHHLLARFDRNLRLVHLYNACTVI